jgi:prolipoprotein diacylglyceryltransferase
MSSDLIDNSPARGTYHRMKKTICVFPRYPTLLYQIFISFSFFFFLLFWIVIFFSSG